MASRWPHSKSLTYSCYPEALLCKLSLPFANQNSCLISPQLDTLYHIYSNYIDTNQTFDFSHLALGVDPTPLACTDVTNAPAPLGTLWLQNFLLNNTNWSYMDLDYSIIQLADRLNPGMVNADGFDLSAFRDKAAS